MFSMPGESDLVESFVFGQGRIQIPSLACLFDFLIWNEFRIYGDVVVQFYHWFKFYFPLFQTHYQTLQYPKTKGNKI